MQSKNVDFVLCPNVFSDKPPKIADLNKESANDFDENDAVKEFKMDYYTTLTNCLGVPALTIPVSHDDASYENFPSSIRMQGFFGEDYHLLRLGHKIEHILQN